MHTNLILTYLYYFQKPWGFTPPSTFINITVLCIRNYVDFCSWFCWSVHINSRQNSAWYIGYNCKFVWWTYYSAPTKCRKILPHWRIPSSTCCNWLHSYKNPVTMWVFYQSKIGQLLLKVTDTINYNLF